MAVELRLTRSLRGLEPADDDAREAIKAWPIGQELKAEVVIPRDNARLRYFWGLVKVILENSEIYSGKEDAAKSIKLSVGHVDMTQVYENGQWRIERTPKSIALHAMEEPDFLDFIKRVERFVCEVLCVSEAQLADAMTDYIAPGFRRVAPERKAKERA